MVDKDGMELLDFDPDVPQQCEHPRHGDNIFGHTGPGWALINSLCPDCSKASAFYICQAGYTNASLVRCGHCDLVKGRDYFWTILRLIGK